jgi:hypothetical protein
VVHEPLLAAVDQIQELLEPFLANGVEALVASR